MKLIEPVIPSDVQERVERTAKQLLSLADAHRTGIITVRVTDGFSVQLAGLIDRRQDHVLWRLIIGIGQPKLGGRD